MKKILALLSVTLLLAITMTGCGKYETHLADYGVQYVSKEYKNLDGSYPGIIVTDVVRKNDNTIEIKTETPPEQLEYALKNFLAISAIKANGDSNDKLSIKIKEENENGTIIVTGDVKEAKYIQILPYKYKDNFLEFEIK